jgi:hypothetical protein
MYVWVFIFFRFWIFCIAQRLSNGRLEANLRREKHHKKIPPPLLREDEIAGKTLFLMPSSDSIS